MDTCMSTSLYSHQVKGLQPRGQGTLCIITQLVATPWHARLDVCACAANIAEPDHSYPCFPFHTMQCARGCGKV
jgi:hypothetical protein